MGVTGLDATGFDVTATGFDVTGFVASGELDGRRFGASVGVFTGAGVEATGREVLLVMGGADGAEGGATGDIVTGVAKGAMVTTLDGLTGASTGARVVGRPPLTGFVDGVGVAIGLEAAVGTGASVTGDIVIGSTEFGADVAAI